MRYIDVRQLYIDALVASKLCVGGPCAYKLTEQASGITNEWLFENVVPNLRRRFPNDTRLCRALGLALLHAALDSELKDWVRVAIQQRIEAAWTKFLEEECQVDVNADGFEIPNAVKKVRLVVYRVQEQLMIDEVAGEDPPAAGGGGVAGGNVAGGNGSVSQEQHQALLIQLQQIRDSMHANHQQTQATLNALRLWIESQLLRINNNVRRFGGTIQGGLARQGNQRQRQQVVQQERQANAEGHAPGSATLSQQPRTLLLLWEEYQFGIGGRKPAKDWTSRERNNREDGIKQKYYRRNIVWQSIDRQVRAGLTAAAACHQIRNHYGFRDSVTSIINKMKFDRTNNRLPDGF